LNFRLDFNTGVNSEFIRAVANSLSNLKSLSLAFAGSDTIIDSDALITLGQLKELNEVNTECLKIHGTQKILLDPSRQQFEYRESSKFFALSFIFRHLKLSFLD
jgi:hypothetical protein